MQNYVIIKPDAFELTTSAELAKQLCYDFAYFLLHSGVNPENVLCRNYAEEAVWQIHERSQSEESFKGKTDDAVKIAQALVSLAETVFGVGQFPVAEVLKLGLTCIGHGEFIVKKCIFFRENIESIYSESDSVIMNRLYQYLDGKEVALVQMKNADIFVLQWWKTFSRHFFWIIRLKSIH